MRLALLVLLLLVGGLAAPAAAQQSPDVVVVGVTGLRWAEVGEHTPALRALADEGAVGLLSVKAVPALTCRADGWLTLGAGTRAQAFPAQATERCLAVPLADLDEQVRRNAGTLDGARVGALRDVLGDRAAASGDGARLALGLPARPTGPAPPDAALRLVELPALPARPGPDDLRRLDRRLRVELRGLPATTDVLVVGLAEADGDGTADLGVAVATGPSFDRGALRSASTRRAPYVQLVDVAPTVLALLGEPVPDAMDGEPWQVRGPAPAVGALVDLSQRASTARAVTVPFFVVLVAVLGVLMTVLRRRPRALRLVALSGTAAVGASYAAQLVPWERSPEPLLALLVVVAVLSVATALLARSVGVVCGLGALVLVADLLSGAPLQVDAVAGYSPLVAGRFAGLGNVAFGVYGTVFVLAAAFLAARRPPRQAAAVVAALGVVAVVVAGAPDWGSDVGGVLALVPAFVLLGLRVSGERVSASRLALAAVGAAAVVTAFALLDLARPPGERTHLGRFAADVRDGTAADLLVRKATSVLDLLLANPVTAALPLVVAAAAWLLLRPPPLLRRALDAEPGLRHGLPAVGLLAAVGFLVNDSGAAVPALALLVAVPATVAVVARVVEAGGA